MLARRFRAQARTVVPFAGQAEGTSATPRSLTSALKKSPQPLGIDLWVTINAFHQFLKDLLMALRSNDTIWVYPEVDPEWHQTIIKEFSIHPVTAYVLAARGFKTSKTSMAISTPKLPDLSIPSFFPTWIKLSIAFSKR